MNKKSTGGTVGEVHILHTAEEDGEAELQHRHQNGLDSLVTLGTLLDGEGSLVGFTELGRAHELALLAGHGLEHCLGIIHRHAHAQRQQRNDEREHHVPAAGAYYHLGGDVEQADRNSGEEEQGEGEQHHLPLVPGPVTRGSHHTGAHRHDQEAQQDKCQVGIVAGQVRGGLHLGLERSFGTPDIKEHLAADLDATLRPAVLLGLEAVHIHRQLGGGEKKFCRALFIKKYPSSLSDRFLNEITSLPVHSITSIDVVPIPKDMTTKVLQKKYLGIESDIIKQQRVRNKNNDFSSEISYNKRIEKKEIEEIMDDVRENDQCLYYVAVTIILMADSKEELDSMTETVETIGKRNSVTIEEHYLKQREALNTALPIGVRQVETMRTMLTQSLAVLMPFNVQELNDGSGCYYGINQVSKNINIGNRKKLINGNGFVFGVPGSGKSHFCKMELGQVFLGGEDEIIIIDPMNEYFDIAHTYGGTVVNMSTYTDNYVNPLDMDVWSLDLNDSKGMIREKGEFMLGLCEQCMGESLNSRQKSIIDRCVRKLYIEIARSREKYVPVMSDFYDILMNQPEEEAKDIALSLELFVNGSLNIFNHQTNVDVDNRFTVYGIRDLGTELSPITMLVMMESIQNRIIENGKRGIATWLYIDEFHVLLNSEYSAKYLQQLWKKVRKQGGLCTGITQNVVDLLQNYTATTMLANSEFVALLKQANTDSSKMAEVIGVSEAQLRFVTNTQSGMGLMKCGNVVIPFDNTIEKGTDLYNLYNTNIHEKIAQQKAKEQVS